LANTGIFSEISNRIKAAVIALALLILLLLPVFGLSPYYIQILMGVFIFIVMTSSLRLVSLSGQISLGHAGFMCIGAYTSAIISKNLEWSPWLTIPLAAIVSFIIAFLIAIPFSRLRGLYFTMISLFFGMAVIAINEVMEKVTGGRAGLNGIPKLFENSAIPYYYFFIIFMVVCLLVMHRLEFSRIGLTWKSIAQSHTVASSAGIHEARQRIMCFAIGGLFAGLAGAAYAHNVYIVLSVTTFSFFNSIYVFVYMMVGGLSSFYGPIFGTALILLIQAFARGLKEYVPFIPAGILLIILFLLPDGLVSLPARIRHLFDKQPKDPKIPVQKGVNDNAS
jgi:branched-chain amino acid transport system permease protein